MKRCPECRRDYYDETLLYCLEDGVQLVQGSVPVSQTVADEPATAIFHTTDVGGEAPTRAQIHTTEQTAVLPSGIAALPKSGFDKRLLALPFLLAIIGLGGFFAYKYFSPTKQIESIAVMPFVNEGGNADVEYLSDGMTESLINSLSQLPKLSVKARSSVFRYKGKDLDSKQIAGELGVHAILNGRVLQRGEMLTLSLDLVDAVTGNQIWGEQYNRNVGDLLSLQKEIARDVSNKLRSKLSGEDEQQLAKSPTVDPEAYQLYLQGRYQWNKRTPESIRKARPLFEKAIERDPRYALAYVGVADSHVVVDDGAPHDENPKAKAAALKALELDPTLGEAHAVLANSAFFYELNWPNAEREYKRAIELSPNYPTAYHWYGESLSAVGRFEESFAMYERALKLDPLSLAIQTDLGRAYYVARQSDRAIQYLKKVEELDPSYVRTHFYLAGVYEEEGMFEQAIESRRKGILLDGGNIERFAENRRGVLNAVAAAGEKEYWRTLLALTQEAAKLNGKPLNPAEMAELYSRLDEKDKAFEWLETCFRERRVNLVFLNVEPAYDNIRSDPRFAEFVRRVGTTGDARVGGQ